jgi:hypothetical protein
LLSRSLTGRASTSLGTWRGSRARRSIPPATLCNDVARSRVAGSASTSRGSGEARRQGGERGNGQSKPREPRRPQPDATTLRGAGSPAAFPIARTLAWLAGKAESAAASRSNRENRGARNPMQRRCADRPDSPFDPLRQLRNHPPAGGLMASANRRRSSKRMSEAFTSNSGARRNSSQNQALGMRTRFPGGRLASDRGQERPLSADPRARQAGGAEAGASLLPGRLSCGATGAETPLRCAVTSQSRIRQRCR